MVGQKHNITVGGDREQRILGVRTSVAVVAQSRVLPKTWIGSEDVNVLETLCDLLDLVGLMNSKLAIHTHGSTRLPSNEVFLASSTVSSEFKKTKSIRF